MKRSYHTEDKEPESNFKLPSEGEYLFQVTDVNPLVEPSGENENIQIAKIEIIGGEFEGISLIDVIYYKMKNPSILPVCF
jgi:hypothetical protein